ARLILTNNSLGNVSCFIISFDTEWIKLIDIPQNRFWKEKMDTSCCQDNELSHLGFLMIHMWSLLTGKMMNIINRYTKNIVMNSGPLRFLYV
ncbi:hypothetical protein ACJX0J_031455, partial [Zea mays]